MKNPNRLHNPKKTKRLPPSSWDGLGNVPRNENLAKIRVGSFEKQEHSKEKDITPNPSYSFKDNKK